MRSVLAMLVGRLKYCAWLDRRRVIAYGAILLACEIATFLFLIAGTHGWIVPLDKPLTTDFASFYAAGSLADAGTPALAYDQAAHYAAEQQATAPGIQYQFFFYPPVFIMLCALLARLPYLVAFVAFEAAGLLLYLFAVRGILGERGLGPKGWRLEGWKFVIPFLAFPAVFWTLGLGQNALLTAALFGFAMLLVDRRPVLSGILFGLLCYKPHLGLLIPVALAAGRRWPAFAAASASAALLVLASIGGFGWDTWQAYFAAAGDSHSTYEFGRINLAGMISPFAALRVLGLGVAPAYVVQALATLAAMALVAYVWWRDMSIELRGAALAAATLIAVPVILLYDLMLAAIAAAWLVRAARATGYLPWEKAALVTVFAVPLLALSLGQGWHVPVAPLAALLLLGLVIRRAAAPYASSRIWISSPTTRTG
ncbi:MAG TPA: glycosyltransferase family 87 protein [Stellaceae bacterium]|nr:glycosyltransferase family 87 protein [Stellaceae bacterium]